MKKRGQIGVHFHWIFVLIAGAIILTFFVSIVIKQKDISEQRIAGKAISGLDQIFSASGVTEDTFNKIDIPNIQLEFACRGDFSEYSIIKTGLNRNLGTEILFSPNFVKGDSVFIWTLPWSMPFRIDNFLIITSPEVRYIFLYDSDKEYEASIIYDDLPAPITKEFIPIESINSIKDKNNYKIKLIYISNQQPDILNINLPKWIEKQDVSLTLITNNYVQFYEKQSLAFVSDYTTHHFPIRDPFPRDSKDPMLYAAIFSEDIDMYKCAMTKAFKRLDISSKIYQKRVDYLEEFYEDLFSFTGAPYCEQFYVSSYYYSLVSESSACVSNINNCDFDQISRSATEIESNNLVILENTDCPLIY